MGVSMPFRDVLGFRADGEQHCIHTLAGIIVLTRSPVRQAGSEGGFSGIGFSLCDHSIARQCTPVRRRVGEPQDAGKGVCVATLVLRQGTVSTVPSAPSANCHPDRALRLLQRDEGSAFRFVRHVIPSLPAQAGEAELARPLAGDLLFPSIMEGCRL
jgi:hypothetical protein